MTLWIIIYACIEAEQDHALGKQATAPLEHAKLHKCKAM